MILEIAENLWYADSNYVDYTVHKKDNTELSLSPLLQIH